MNDNEEILTQEDIIIMKKAVYIINEYCPTNYGVEIEDKTCSKFSNCSECWKYCIENLEEVNEQN